MALIESDLKTDFYLHTSYELITHIDSDDTLFPPNILIAEMDLYVVRMFGSHGAVEIYFENEDDMVHYRLKFG